MCGTKKQMVARSFIGHSDTVLKSGNEQNVQRCPAVDPVALRMKAISTHLCSGFVAPCNFDCRSSVFLHGRLPIWSRKAQFFFWRGLSSTACSAVTHSQCFHHSSSFAQTSFTSRTSAENPLHGVGYVIWCKMFALPGRPPSFPPRSDVFSIALYFFLLSCALPTTSAVLPGLPGIIFVPHSYEARTWMLLFQHRTHYPHRLQCPPRISSVPSPDDGNFTLRFSHPFHNSTPFLLRPMLFFTTKLLQFRVKVFLSASSARDHELLSRETCHTFFSFHQKIT